MTNSTDKKRMIRRPVPKKPEEAELQTMLLKIKALEKTVEELKEVATEAAKHINNLHELHIVQADRIRAIRKEAKRIYEQYEWVDETEAVAVKELRQFLKVTWAGSHLTDLEDVY